VADGFSFVSALADSPPLCLEASGFQAENKLSMSKRWDGIAAQREERHELKLGRSDDSGCGILLEMRSVTIAFLGRAYTRVLLKIRDVNPLCDVALS
jgi:hypothetical protein